MIPVKVQCGCGQRYAFDVEPVNGRMPSAVACPVCGADGTAAANEIIARTLTASSQAAPPVAVRMRIPVAPTASTATTATSAETAATPSPQRPLPAARGDVDDSEGEKWKWWYFVLAGICIGGYSIWQAYDQHRMKPLGELFFAVFCIAIGIWDFQNKRRKKRLNG
jgi:hypothetical protein